MPNEVVKVMSPKQSEGRPASKSQSRFETGQESRLIINHISYLYIYMCIKTMAFDEVVYKSPRAFLRR